VNNAGTAIPKTFEETTLEELDRLIDINVRGTFVATQAALKHIKSGGRIIMIGSCVGERTMTPGLVPYSATKGAVNGGKAACDFNTQQGSSDAHHEGLRKSGSHPRRALLKWYEKLDGIERSQLAFLGFALTTQARVQAHCSSVSALNEWVPRAMDHHSSGCLPVEKFPTFASGRQDRGQVNPSDFRPQFRLTRLRDVAREESLPYGDGSAKPVVTATTPADDREIMSANLHAGLRRAVREAG